LRYWEYFVLNGVAIAVVRYFTCERVSKLKWIQVKIIHLNLNNRLYSKITFAFIVFYDT